MRWPWSEKQEMAKTVNESITAPARDEISKSQERMIRVNRILEEAAKVEVLIQQQRQQRKG